MSQNFQKLSQKFSQLQKVLDKRKQSKLQRQKRKQQQANDLMEYMQQKTDTMISKLEELKRKQTILFTMLKVQPSIPQNFPKNYFIQVTYEDVVVTGNHKYVDFDENVIEQKFIIPLLNSSKAKVQIWTAEEQPVLFEKIVVDLERIIQECLLNSDKFDDFIPLNTCPQYKITYRIQTQGIGFSSWLKNINLLRQMQTQKEIIKQEERKRREQTRNKLEQKKKQFNKKFADHKKQQTKEYQNEGIDQILNILADD